jgi:hypothetical protein
MKMKNIKLFENFETAETILKSKLESLKKYVSNNKNVINIDMEVYPEINSFDGGSAIQVFYNYGNNYNDAEQKVQKFLNDWVKSEQWNTDNSIEVYPSVDDYSDKENWWTMVIELSA